MRTIKDTSKCLYTYSHVHMRGQISVTGVQTPEIHIYNAE